MGERRTCLILTTTGADTSNIERALEKSNINFESNLEISIGDSHLTSIIHSIRDVDFILAYLPKQSHMGLSNLFFELGIAIGETKPVILLANRGDERLSSIPDLRTIWVRPETDIEMALSLHLKTIPLGKYRINRTNDTLPVPDNLSHNLRKKLKIPKDFGKDEEKASLMKDGGPMWASILESQVAELLINSGIRVLGADDERLKNNNPDLVAWSSELEALQVNPILLEIKSGDIKARNKAIIIRQMKRLMHDRSAGFGIVVHTGRGGTQCLSKENWPIYSISLDDLREKTSKDIFTKWISKAWGKWKSDGG